MMDAIRELKIRAEILHKRVHAGDARAMARLRALPAFRRSSDAALSEFAPAIRRQHCLAVIAAELGFANWPHARRALTGEGPTADFGTLLCPRRCGAHINIWFARYEEAAAVRKKCDGYLLGYRRQYIVVDRFYIESIGLDPGDTDWKAMGFDWVRPRSRAARTRLYSKLVALLPRDAA